MSKQQKDLTVVRFNNWEGPTPMRVIPMVRVCFSGVDPIEMTAEQWAAIEAYFKQLEEQG